MFTKNIKGRNSNPGIPTLLTLVPGKFLGNRHIVFDALKLQP